ncbi:MAG: DUF4065 domain-containing protein [Nitrosopumilus sp.]|nr:DUF4065 domain-containing protein [Nitrosopumilus sp.]MDA7944046.1 DUF4065 domain-containing protein [Nitrosopumilus sp.]MDA7999427.1 DUF4065 domain-containing protein [Nitrosopumilus sp.]
MSQMERQVHEGTTPVVVVGDYITGMGRGVFTHLQVLKMAFLSHGYTLAIRDRPLFVEEIQAWEYGPVIPALYNALRMHGGAPIPHLYSCKTLVTSPDLENRMRELGEMFDPENLKVVEKTVEVFRDYKEFQLSYITHMDGSPWRAAYDRGGQFATIEDDELMSYYKKQLDGVL